jgi:hypothetical protein
VDTSEWTVETIDEQVAEVRGMYLRALGQDKPEKPKMVPRVVGSDTE